MALVARAIARRRRDRYDELARIICHPKEACMCSSVSCRTSPHVTARSFHKTAAVYARAMPPKKYSRGGTGRRVPKADELTEAARPVRAQNVAAPIVVCVHKYSDRAADLWPAIEDQGASLYHIQMDHTGRPSIIDDIFGSVNKLLREACAGNPELPTSVGELARAGIRLVLTNSEGPEGAGVSTRMGLQGGYVGGRSAREKELLPRSTRSFDGGGPKTPRAGHIHESV